MKKIFNKYLRQYKSVKNSTSIVVGSFSTVAAIIRMFKIQPNEIFNYILEGYNTIFRAPIIWVIEFVNLELPEWFPELFLAYIFLGVVTTRTFFNLYDNRTRVTKGLWGKLTWNKYSKKIFGVSKIGVFSYKTLAVAIWPIITIDYLFIYKKLWGRYMDDNHSPNFNAKIGLFTTRDKDIDKLIHKNANYSNTLSYDISSDSWYKYEGDFRIIFLTNLILATVIVICLLFFATI